MLTVFEHLSLTKHCPKSLRVLTTASQNLVGWFVIHFPHSHITDDTKFTPKLKWQQTQDRNHTP